jgi:hypothetical protein
MTDMAAISCCRDRFDGLADVEAKEVTGAD